MVSVKGIIKNGLVEPLEPIEGQEGQEVTITLNKDETKLVDNSSKVSWDDLLNFIDENAIDTGIEDLAHQHDHYLYGTPKKEPYP